MDKTKRLNRRLDIAMTVLLGVIAVASVILLSGCFANGGRIQTIGGTMEIDGPPPGPDPLDLERNISACGGLHEKGSAEYCGCLLRHEFSASHEYASYCQTEPISGLVPGGVPDLPPPAGGECPTCPACPECPADDDCKSEMDGVAKRAQDQLDARKRQHNACRVVKAQAQETLERIRNGCSIETGKMGYFKPGAEIWNCDVDGHAAMQSLSE